MAKGSDPSSRLKPAVQKLIVLAIIVVAAIFLFHEANRQREMAEGNTLAIQDLRESISERLDEISGKIQGSVPSLPAHLAIRAGHKGAKTLCNYTDEALERILGLPHESVRGGRRYYVGGSEWIAWTDAQTPFFQVGPKEPGCILATTNDPDLGCSDELPCLHAFYLRHRSTDPLVLNQLYEQGEHRYLKPSQHAFDYILDAGANIGIASVLFASMYPSARIISLEPSASNFATLLLNTAPYPTIHPVNAALWPRVAQLSLILGTRDPGLPPEWGYRVMEHSEVPEGRKVEETLTGVSVPFLLMVSGLPRFDFLKIDIEGSEKKLFSPEPENDLSWVQSAKVIALEVHEDVVPGANATVAACFARYPDFRILDRDQGEYRVYVRT